MVLTWAATPLDSLPQKDGVPFVPPDLNLFLFDSVYAKVEQKKIQGSVLHRTGLGTPDYRRMLSLLIAQILPVSQKESVRRGHLADRTCHVGVFLMCIRLRAHA